jgi:plastocyanin
MTMTPPQTPREPRRYGRRSVLVRSAALLLTLPLAACGRPAMLQRGTDGRYTVDLTTDSRFDPGGLTIPRGSTVVFRNQATVPHTVTVDPEAITGTRAPEGVATWDSGDLLPGRMWSRQFDEPGEYVFGCRYHSGEGMIGTLIVE